MKRTLVDPPNNRHQLTTADAPYTSEGAESRGSLQDFTSLLPERDPPEAMGLLGSGGMATVHLAKDEPLAREVALKRLHADVHENPRKQEEFVREARILGQLQHPGILPVFQLARDKSGHAYFTMQVIDGRSLRQFLNAPNRSLTNPTRVQQGIEILLKVCDAVAYAHSRGFIHRDIKPDNVMIGLHGRVYLVDWGVALGPDDHGQGKTPRFAGTPGYMAPEQARAETLDERVDIFGLGAILFEILTGKIPFSEESGDLMREEIEGRVEKTRQVAPRSVPQGLCEVCDRALAADRAARYATVEEFQTDLKNVLSGGILLPRKIFEKGEIIVLEGDPGDAAYLVVDGSCSVTQGSGPETRTLRTMTEGDIFGELALLLDGPRTATVTALERTTLLVMDRRALEQSGALHGFPAELLRALAKRFFDLESKLR